MSEEPAPTHAVRRFRDVGPSRVPAWGYVFILPCAALALAGIDLGAHDPPCDPVVEGIKQMIAVVACAGGAFGVALVSRLRRPITTRLPLCLLLAAAGALAFAWAVPRSTGVDWRRLDGGAWSVELPGSAELSHRTAPTPSGEMPLSEAVATARGATFRVQESEPPQGATARPAALLARARAEALRSGRERIVDERPLEVPGNRDGARGLELRFHLDGRDFRSRIYAAPPRVIVLTAGPLDAAGPDADRFLSSLRLR